MKRIMCALLTGLVVLGCQSTRGPVLSQNQSHGQPGQPAGSFHGTPLPTPLPPQMAQGQQPKPSEAVNPEITQTSFLHPPASHARMFSEKIARVEPSHGGPLPGTGWTGYPPAQGMMGGPGMGGPGMGGPGMGGPGMAGPGMGGPGMGGMPGQCGPGGCSHGCGSHGRQGGGPPMPPMPPMMGPGGCGMCGRSQVLFCKPHGMQIAWQTFSGGWPDSFTAPQVEAPGRYNFQQARIYRLKISNIQTREGLDLYPTLEIYPGNAKIDAFLAHNAIPVEFTDEDFDQVLAGNFVTKVIYLPDPKFQELAIAGVECLVSTRLDPGIDPVEEAHRRGAIMAVVRLGGVDLEMPSVPPLFCGDTKAPAKGAPAVAKDAKGPIKQIGFWKSEPATK